MPRLSTWFVHASLVYLALGFTLGALLLVNKSQQIYPPIWKLLPIHIEVLLMGWFVQLAVGVAFWILPRLSGEHPRSNEVWIWTTFWLINMGIVVVALDAIISQPGLLLAGRLVELGGVLVFIASAWRRVKSFNR